MTKVLRITPVGVSVIAVIVAASAVALDKSLPYRIGPGDYARFLWLGRISIAALILPFVAIGLGIGTLSVRFGILNAMSTGSI